MREGFVVYHEWLESLSPFSDAECGRLLKAMIHYSATRETTELVGNERFIWPTFAQRIDRDRSAYEARCQTNRDNRQRSSTTEDDGQRSSTVVNETARNAPTKTKTETKTETETKTKTRGTGEKRAREESDDGFEAFWAAYPRKSGDMREAYLAYLDALQTGAQLKDFMTALEWQRAVWAADDPSGRYIPSPKRWLENRQWTEARREPKEKRPNSVTTAADYESATASRDGSKERSDLARLAEILRET